ncbi:MAG: tetratricopeptide repeat protein [Akkermansia sp.]|nr:tetratricopeptide repeat protein [Akkermansia sp.]
MTFSPRFNTSSSRLAAVLGIASLLGLSACNEKEAEAPAPVATEQPEAEAATPPPAEPAPATNMLEEARTALFNHAVYTLGQQVSSPDAFPELNHIVKDMLELMRSYYAELQKGEPTEERARLAVQIANTTRDLGAFTKAEAEYDNALKELESLPEELRTKAENKRLLSSCYNGLGVCALLQNKAAEALPRYEQALQIDEQQYKAVAPAEGTALPESDVDPVISRAAADYMDSCRCLGDCQRAMGDVEEALTTYLKGDKMVQGLKRLSPEMSISYVKLLTSIGNLQNSQNHAGEALKAWTLAAQICQSVNASSPRLDIKAETKRCFDALLPAIQTVGQHIQASQEAAAKEAEAKRQEEEKAAAELEAEAKAAAERLAAEQKAAEEKAAAEKAAAEKAAAEKAAAEKAAAEKAASKRNRKKRH